MYWGTCQRRARLPLFALFSPPILGLFFFLSAMWIKAVSLSKMDEYHNSRFDQYKWPRRKECNF